MSPTVICFKCKEVIKKNESILCFKCKNHYHFDCAGCSEKLYNLMDPKKKQNWTCLICSQKQNKKKPVKTDDNNVTLRKKQLHSLPKQNDTESSQIECQQQTTLTSGTISTPSCYHKQITLIRSQSSENVTHAEEDINATFKSFENKLSQSFELTNDLDIVTDLKLQLSQLQLKLQSADQEIENTILENNDLTRQLEKATREICMLKNIVYTTPTKMQKGLINTPRSCTSDRPVITKTLNIKIRKLEYELKQAQDEILQLNETIRNLERNLADYKISLANQNNFVNSNYSENKSISQRLSPEHDCDKIKKVAKNKLCIISSCKRYKILQSVINSKSFDNYQLCHYLTPNAGIKMLLTNIKNKLKGYTKNDWCIVLVGENDFQISQDYTALISYIKEELKKLTFTNIIVLSPSYICGAPIYNYRVEIFNESLYNDMKQHNYGLLIDSNRYVTLDMFSTATGKLKNIGMKTILEEVAQLIKQTTSNCISNENSRCFRDKDPETENEKQFFL